MSCCAARILATLFFGGLASGWSNGALARVAEDNPAVITFYGGRLIANDLPRLPVDILRAHVDWRSSYFIGAGYTQPLPTPHWLDGPIGLSTSIEFIGLRHFGGQHNLEVDIAYMVRTPYHEWSGLRFRGGGGLGPSLALGRPSAEDGPDDHPEKRSRLQNYIALELEISGGEADGAALVLRVHHRSGAYGLVAPNGVGSNFLTLGLRRAF